jgi:hypothetical protein
MGAAAKALAKLSAKIWHYVPQTSDASVRHQ